MKLSVVSAVDDHVLEAAEWFGALVEQTAAPDSYEVIAMDAHRMDAWQTAFESLSADGGEHPRIVYRQLEPGGRARSLNAALDEATGDVIVFLADDFIPGPDFIDLHRRFHVENPGREAVGVGRALVPPERQHGPFARWLERSGQFFGVPLDEESESIPDDFFYVGNASVKRALVDAAGRFDEDFPYHAWDDHEFGLRLRSAGMRSRLIPDATVVHDHPITLRERARQMEEAGESAAIHAHKQPGDHPWLAPGDVPPWRWRLAAWKWRAAHLLSRSEGHRGLYYERTLSAAYSAGLRRRRARLS